MSWDVIDKKYLATRTLIINSKRASSPEYIDELMKSGDVDFAFSTSEYSKLILDSLLERISSFSKDDQVKSLEILNLRRKKKSSGWFEFGTWLSEPANFNRGFHESFVSVFGREKYLLWVLRGYNFPDLVDKTGGSLGYRFKNFPDENVSDLLSFVSKNMTSKIFCGYKKSWTHKRVEAVINSVSKLSVNRSKKTEIISNILTKITVEVDEDVRKKICEVIGMEVLHGKTYRTVGRQLSKAVVIFGVSDE